MKNIISENPIFRPHAAEITPCGESLTVNRVRGLCKKFNCCKSSIYNDIESGLLPPLIKFGERMSGLPEYEVDLILTARIAGYSHDDIKSLVQNLVAARKTLIGHSAFLQALEEHKSESPASDFNTVHKQGE